jgi:glyoxylase-like metal-dependent hydrolase (beta-lactamase superfamily II)
VRFHRLSEHVYSYADACNVYVIRHFDRALLIDCGTGEVLSHLGNVGITEVDWVLHTHYHRDQCQGDAIISAEGSKIAVPAAEADFYERADEGWQTRRIYDLYDCTNVFNAPIRSVVPSYRLQDYECFRWQNLEICVLPTPGHTKGSVTYLADIDGQRYAFCGDVIYGDGRLWTLHDLQWNYCDTPDALNVALHSVNSLRRRHPDVLAPSHGEAIHRGGEALESLETRMRRLHQAVNHRFQAITESPCRLSIDCRFNKVSDHLIAAMHPTANFYVLRADSGEVLLFDYGFPSYDHGGGAVCRFVEHSLSELERDYGVARPGVVIVTHYHDDHVAGIPYLQREFGTEVWAYENMVDILQQPHAHRIPCLWPEPITVDRVLREGEIVEWNGYRFKVHHNPGHTWYAAAYFGEIDARRAAIVGDELLVSGTGALRGGGPTYRNRVYSNSFTVGIAKIMAYEPEILLTGHNGALKVSPIDLQHVYEWAGELEASWRDLAPAPNMVEFALDPNFVNMQPYQSRIGPNMEAQLRVEVRNHDNIPTAGVVRVIVPDDWRAEPEERKVTVAAGASCDLPFTVIPPAGTRTGVRHVVTADVKLGSHRFGQLAECLITLDESVRKGAEYA